MNNKYKKALLITSIFLVTVFVFSQNNNLNILKASTNTYYFNNAIDTSPSEIGNYWLDVDLTLPAIQLPAAGDVVNVVGGSVYDGNATFNGNATNDGEVTGSAVFRGNSLNNNMVDGDATFYGVSTHDTGVVQGTKTRYINTQTNLLGGEFKLEGGWNVVVDGVGLSGIENIDQYNNSGNSFSAINGGYYDYAKLSSSYFTKNSLVLTFNRSLSTSSIPAISDFQVNINNTPVAVSSVSVTGTNVVLAFASPVVGNTLKFQYLPTNTAIKTIEGIPVGSIAPSQANLAFPLSVNITSMIVNGSKIYGYDNIEDKLYVIDKNTMAVVATINLGSDSGFMAIYGTKLYICHVSNNTISTIDLKTNTLIATIPTGNYPINFAVVGTKLYVNNLQGNSISVVDTRTDAITKTLTTGLHNPYYSISVGSKLYISNYAASPAPIASVTVVDTITETVLKNIPASPGVFNLAPLVSVGTNLYVLSGIANTIPNNGRIMVINTITDTIVHSQVLGDSLLNMLAVGNKIYIARMDGNKQYIVFDTLTNSILSTIPNITGPLLHIGNKLYAQDVNSSGAGEIKVIDIETDSIIDTVRQIEVGELANVDEVLLNLINDKIMVIDTKNLGFNSPYLNSFSSTTVSGSYVAGQTINISANFNSPISSGSVMTVALNSGATVVLNNASGSTLSGTYTIGNTDKTPDLSVSNIVSASVSDGNHIRTNYSVPSSVGNFLAENSTIARNIGDSKNISIGSYFEIQVGNNPYQISPPVNVGYIKYMYVANQGSNTVSVVNLSKNVVTKTIPVGSEPYGLSLATVGNRKYLYVANTGSNTVSVIDTITNNVVKTIPVGIKPYYVLTLGTNVYVTNGQSNSVSIIDATSNIVTDTIPVGTYPRGIKALGTDIYVANYGAEDYGGSSISVIDSLTKKVTKTIVLPSGSSGPRGVVALGTYIYVTNYRSNNLSVIDTTTNSIIATLPVGKGPRGIIGLGTKIYVENFDEGTISIVDSATNTTITTLPVGHSPSGMSVDGENIYYSRFQDGIVSILNLTTNTLRPKGAFDYSVSGPGFGMINKVSPIFTITPNSIFSGTITATANGGGINTPIIKTFVNSSQPQTFTVTPNTKGTVTFTFSNDMQLPNPSNLTYFVSGPVVSNN